MSEIVITVQIDDAHAEPLVAQCYNEWENVPPVVDLIRDLIIEGSISDLIDIGGFFDPAISITLNGQPVQVDL